MMIVLLWILGLCRVCSMQGMELDRGYKCFRSESEINRQFSNMHQHSGIVIIMNSDEDNTIQYNGEECNISKGKLCIFKYEQEGRVQMLDRQQCSICVSLSSMGKLGNMRMGQGRRRVQIYMGEQQLLLYRPLHSIQLQLYKYKGNMLAQVNVCPIYYISQCLKQIQYRKHQQLQLLIQPKPQEPIMTYFQSINIDYCATCVAIVSFKCFNHYCQFAMTDASDNEGLKRIQGNQVMQVDGYCVYVLYGNISINGTHIEQEYACAYGHNIISNTHNHTSSSSLITTYHISQQVQLMEGFPVGWQGQFYYVAHNNIIFILVQTYAHEYVHIRVQYTNITIQYQLNKTLALSIYEQNLGMVNISVQHGGYVMNVYEQGIINMRYGHHYPYVASFHSPAKFVLSNAQQVSVGITKCTLGTIVVRYRCEQDVVSILVQSLSYVLNINCMRESGRASTLYIQILSKNYVVLDVYVSKHHISIPTYINTNTTYSINDGMYRFNSNHDNVEMRVFVGRQYNELSKYMFCNGVIFSANGHMTDSIQLSQSQSSQYSVPQSYKYIGIIYVSNATVFYTILDLNQQFDWVKWSIAVGILLLVAHIWVFYNILRPSTIHKYKKQ